MHDRLRVVRSVVAGADAATLERREVPNHRLARALARSQDVLEKPRDALRLHAERVGQDLHDRTALQLAAQVRHQVFEHESCVGAKALLVLTVCWCAFGLSCPARLEQTCRRIGGRRKDAR